MTTPRRAAKSGRARSAAQPSLARPGRTRRLVAAAGLVIGCLVLSPAPAPAQSVADGIAAFRQGDYQAARDIWRPLAEAGDPVAQFNLAKLYEYGGGEVRQDYPQAARWYREAADRGIAEAQNNLGLMYAQGLGVARDARRAAELWQRAAKEDYNLAQYNLALAYFRGEGVDRDVRMAAAWFEQAARAGLADAQYAMGQLLRLGRVAPLDEGQALAWYERAAAQGHAEAAAQAESLKGRGVVAKDPVPIGPAPARAAAPREPAREPAGEPPAVPATPGGDTAGGQAAGEDLTGGVAPAAVAPSAARDSAPGEASDGAGVAAEVPVPEPKPDRPAVSQTAAVPPDEADAAPAAARSEAGAEPGSQTETEYRLWLISADSAAAAEHLRGRALARHGEVLSGVKLDIYEMDYGERGHFYRILAGPLYSAEAANDLCRRLREDDPEGFCKVLTR